MKQPLNLPWLFKMAWRDSRKNRSRLFLFVSSIVLGIAALVAIYSFGDNLKQNITDQAATLIGADLVISANKAVTPPIQKLIDSLGDDKSQERDFVSMVQFSKGTRLIQIKALQGAFPYYGDLETTPEAAGKNFKNSNDALVDKTLVLQFGAKVGDTIHVGKQAFKIAGILNKAPGQSGVASSVAPIVYIPFQYLQQTGLVQQGSRLTYKYYFKYNHQVDMAKLVKNIEPRLEKEGINYDTIDTQKEQTGKSFADLTSFLALVGFIALLLGCIGVASAIHIYVREKIATIAVLRCLGVKAAQAFLIYLIQIVGVGLIGSIIGSLLGTVIQQILPVVLKDFIPFVIDVTISWKAIGQGILLGLIISVLFALSPLLSVRNVSPLNTLRMSFEETSLTRDPLKWLVYALILLFIAGFTYLQLQSVVQTVVFVICILLAFLILAGMARLLMWLVKRFFPFSWSYLWRQGFSNLYRPNNQSVILIISIGLGTAFICTLFFIQGILMERVSMSSSGNQPNMILFDIQANQKEGVAALIKKQNLPVISQVPIVTMALTEINGKNYAQLKKDTSLKLPPHFVMTREYRVTYRDSLTNTEKITEGKWIGKSSPNQVIPISVEERYAHRSRLHLNDKLLFNVQGVPMLTQIKSLRQVNYNRVQSNFLVVFPAGVLEQAPRFYVDISRVPNSKVSASFQQTMVRNFPNISVIDLALILSVIDELLNKIGFVIQFMAGFSILTGIIVLIASVRISKYQRIQESVLLRTLGASRKQILAITALEYLFLGTLAAATGLLLALAGSWALAKFTFDAAFTPHILPVLGIFSLVSLLTVAIGLLNSRGVLSKPPLEILRRDV
ncbi:putative ABC transport system permease protein [Mucilaginibacter gracilis]|uniref:Putative ABC transport system permease protein n=1 Tax=Mucilaginibacter gracilis TaxID=423350 RepID=A0A495J7E6_9SPHI|nr:FtsX-like permease family protein [Mucilaginibacter gracilis]RKR84807.1 putative ABC transport system permease protein [Mucilaginibacter gracilis]